MQGCSVFGGAGPETTLHPAVLEPRTNASAKLAALPVPKGLITVAVYNFRDQTGQYKQAPDSSISTAVSQGAASMLIKALRDSHWFQPVEREGLQDLLTERKILRAESDKPGDKQKSDKPADLPNLNPARLLMEGAIVGYDFNVTTGGLGLKFQGYSLGTQYRKDQVTVNLRAVDINTGNILHSITTTKTVYSKQIQPGVYRYIAYKELMEGEAGYTYNEPVQLAVQEAIEEAVIAMIVEGIDNKSWVLAREEDRDAELVSSVRDALRYRSLGQEPPKPGLWGKNDDKARKAAAKAAAEDATFLDVPAAQRVQDIPLRPVPVPVPAPAASPAAVEMLPSFDGQASNPQGSTASVPAVTVPLRALPPSPPPPAVTPDEALKRSLEIERARKGSAEPTPSSAPARSFITTGGGE